MIPTSPTEPTRVRRTPGHWHWFRWAGEDAFSSATLYACRCGVVRPAR